MEPSTTVFSIMKPLHARRYDELTFPMTHDCHCVGDPKDWTFREKVLRLHSCTQTRGPADQIRDGVRAFRINTCYWKGAVRLNHGPPIAQYVFPVQTVFGPLEEFLQTLRDWLSEEKNKRTVITIFDEGDCPVDKIVQVYEKVFGDLTRWLVERTDGAAFPVLGELVGSGPRVMVWMRQVERERAANQQATQKREAQDVRYRCFHSMWGRNVWQNPWCTYDERHSAYAIWPDDVTANKERGAGHRDSPLYLYNHMFYTEGINELPAHLKFVINRAAGHFETADYCKNNLCVGPLLNYDVIKAWKTTRRRPNFVNVDFYQGVMGAHSNLFPLVSALNHTDLLVPSTVPYPITAIATLHVPTVGVVVVLTAAGALYLTVPNTPRGVMRLSLPEAPRFVGMATLLYDGKQLRIFAVDEEGHLCMGRVSFLAALPLAPVAPIMDDRTMTELHVVGDVPPAAVLYNGKGAPPLSDLRAATFVIVAARRRPERDRAKLVALYEKPNGTWHKHSFGFSSLAPHQHNGALLVTCGGAVWALAASEEGMLVAWRGATTETGAVEWEQSALSEALFDVHGSVSAFSVSDKRILVVGFTPTRQILLHRFSTSKSKWSKSPRILQLGSPPPGMKGHLVCDLHEHTLVVAATAECAHMVDEKLNLKGVAVYSASVSHKSGAGEWRLFSPALVQRISSADARSGAVFYLMQDAAWGSIPFEKDV